MKNILISALVCGLALGASAVDVTITKPYIRRHHEDTHR